MFFMKAKQSGLTLIEILLSISLAAIIFALLFEVNQKLKYSYLKIQSYNYQQSVLLDGWMSMVENIKRVSSPHIYYDNINYTSNSSSLYSSSFSGMSQLFSVLKLDSPTNNIVFSESDFLGRPTPLPAAYRTTAMSSPSNVDIPSDQLVIQYTTVNKNLLDCEGNPIAPRNKVPLIIPIGRSASVETVVERYYVKKQGSQLDLMCDAMRFDSNTGFSGDTVGERVVMPNIDYFHVLIVDNGKNGQDCTPKYQTIDAIIGYLTNTNYYYCSFHTKRLIESVEQLNMSNRVVGGVEVSVLYHSPLIQNTESVSGTPKNKFIVLDKTVTLNGTATSNDAIYDVTTSFVGLHPFKEID